MAKRPRERRGSSGTSGGVDLEPLRGGMREVEAGRRAPQRAGEGRPPAPHHEVRLPPEGEGLAQGDRPGGGAPPPTAPEKSPASVDREASEKLHEERRDHENEAANAPRDDPDAGGAGRPRA